MENVLLASDFSAGSLTAFHHALKAALVAEARLTILHLSREAAAWTDFPGVRETLERWGLLPSGSPKSVMPQLGIEVRKAVAPFAGPVKSVLCYLDDNPADLIVLATQVRDDRASWLQESLGEPIARRSGQMTLYLPDQVTGFVSAENGAISLDRILIPVAAEPLAQPAAAAAAAARLAARLRLPRGTFTLLHIDGADTMPAVQCPEVPDWQWKKVSRTGDVIHGIVDTAGKEKGRSHRDVHRWAQWFPRRLPRQPQRAGVAERTVSGAYRSGRVTGRSSHGMKCSGRSGAVDRMICCHRDGVRSWRW